MRTRRTSPKQLVEIVTGLREAGADLDIGWAYGQPRVTNVRGNASVSPRLSAGEMKLWLQGYQRGLDQGFQLGHEAAERGEE